MKLNSLNKDTLHQVSHSCLIIRQRKTNNIFHALLFLSEPPGRCILNGMLMSTFVVSVVVPADSVTSGLLPSPGRAGRVHGDQEKVSTRTNMTQLSNRCRQWQQPLISLVEFAKGIESQVVEVIPTKSKMSGAFIWVCEAVQKLLEMV